MRRSTLFVTMPPAALTIQPSMTQAPAPQPAANQITLGAAADGTPLRRAPRTGHVSNYDESKGGPAAAK
jgi:hypothetical protein